MAARKSTGAARYRARSANEIRTHPRRKARIPRRKPAHSLERCNAILASLLPRLTAINKAARTGDVPLFQTAVRDLRNEAIAAELLLAKAVRT